MKEHYYPIIYLVVFLIIVLVPLFLVTSIEPFEGSYIMGEVVDVKVDNLGEKVLIVE